ncbi:MAG TPA: aldehyde dehydrogenase family protein [Mycobacteriales bacterium]
MPESLLLHIDGKDVPASDGGTLTVSNPFTGQPLFTAAHATPADVDAAVAAANKSYRDGRWAGLSGRDRAVILSRAARLLAERIDELAELEVAQTGRPLREMRAQLRRLPEWFEYFGALAQTAEGSLPAFSPNHINLVRRRPLGVAGLITPWNHPLLITMKKLSAALAAGNSVVVKPSELAPAAPLRLAALLEEAGVPAGVVNMITGLGATTGRALSEHRGLHRLDVTGGTETGRAVAAAAGRNLIPVSAELGGKAPVIVLGDANLDQAVAGALFASFIATGQTCVQGSKVLVQENIAAEFQDRFLARVADLRLGDPLDPATQVGPLISQAQRERVAGAVDRALAQGARVLHGGQVPSDLPNGWFYEPTVVADVTPQMDIWREEVFGPVSVFDTFTDDAQVIDKANDCPFGLAASIWTSDTSRALRMVDKLDIGIVWVNDHHRVDPASPWGGTKDSGVGTENGRDSYLSYTRPHSTIVSISDQPFDWYATTAELRYS